MKKWKFRKMILTTVGHETISKAQIYILFGPEAGT